MNHDLTVRGSMKIPASAMRWTASRAGGAGGQHVNTTESRVQLRIQPNDCTTIPAVVFARMRQQKPHWFTGSGEILMACGTHRSRQRNQEELRSRLLAGLTAALRAPKKRRPTKPTKGSQRRRLESKKSRGAIKKKRGRVRRHSED